MRALSDALPMLGSAPAGADFSLDNMRSAGVLSLRPALFDMYKEIAEDHFRTQKEVGYGVTRDQLQDVVDFVNLLSELSVGSEGWQGVEGLTGVRTSILSHYRSRLLSRVGDTGADYMAVRLTPSVSGLQEVVNEVNARYPQTLFSPRAGYSTDYRWTTISPNGLSTVDFSDGQHLIRFESDDVVSWQHGNVYRLNGLGSDDIIQVPHDVKVTYLQTVAGELRFTVELSSGKTLTVVVPELSSEGGPRLFRHVNRRYINSTAGSLDRAIFPVTVRGDGEINDVVLNDNRHVLTVEDRSTDLVLWHINSDDRLVLPASWRFHSVEQVGDDLVYRYERGSGESVSLTLAGYPMDQVRPSGTGEPDEEVLEVLDDGVGTSSSLLFSQSQYESVVTESALLSLGRTGNPVSIGVFEASGSVNGETIVYGLSSSDRALGFSIDRLTGEVFYSGSKASLEYERYTLTVSASSGGLSRSCEVQVSYNHAPSSIEGDMDFTYPTMWLPQEESGRTVLREYTGFDLDPDSKLSFSLGDDTPPEFHIDPSDLIGVV